MVSSSVIYVSDVNRTLSNMTREECKNECIETPVCISAVSYKIDQDTSECVLYLKDVSIIIFILLR